MKVTTKGQVTIPQQIRDQLGIRPGTDVEFSVDGNAVRIIATTKTVTSIREAIQGMRGKGSVKMTTDELMALTRGEP